MNLVPVFPSLLEAELDGLLHTSFSKVHDKSINLPQVKHTSHSQS